MINDILDGLDKMFENPKCELTYQNAFELTIAVLLSAQTSDMAVNKVTKELFNKYPDCYSLANANLKDVESIIKTIGLYHNKAKNIIALSKILVDKYSGKVPMDRNSLESLPGIGRKSTNVILTEIFNIPAIAVDTHVARTSKRLNLAKENDDVLAVEKKLMRKIPKERWGLFHHQMVHFGRYICKSRNPRCDVCLLTKCCKVVKKG